MDINTEKLFEELQTAGLPVTEVDVTGRVLFSRIVTDNEHTYAQQIVAAHTFGPSNRQRARSIYYQATCKAGWLQVRAALIRRGISGAIVDATQEEADKC